MSKLLLHSNTIPTHLMGHRGHAISFAPQTPAELASNPPTCKVCRDCRDMDVRTKRSLSAERSETHTVRSSKNPTATLPCKHLMTMLGGGKMHGKVILLDDVLGAGGERTGTCMGCCGDRSEATRSTPTVPCTHIVGTIENLALCRTSADTLVDHVWLSATPEALDSPRLNQRTERPGPHFQGQILCTLSREGRLSWLPHPQFCPADSAHHSEGHHSYIDLQESASSVGAYGDGSFFMSDPQKRGDILDQIGVVRPFQRMIHLVDVKAQKDVTVIRTHGRVDACVWYQEEDHSHSPILTAENQELAMYDPRRQGGTCVQRTRVFNARITDILLCGTQWPHHVLCGGDTRALGLFDLRKHQMIHTVPNVTKFGISSLHRVERKDPLTGDAVIGVAVCSMPSQLVLIPWASLQMPTPLARAQEQTQTTPMDGRMEQKQVDTRTERSGRENLMQATANWVGRCAIDDMCQTVACLTCRGQIQII